MIQAHPVAEFVSEKRFRSYAPGEVANAAGVANVTSPVLQKSVSASRIWPAKAAGPLVPTLAPGAFAVNVRVKASTPGVNAALDWLKQMVFKPSTLLSASSVQEFGFVTRAKGASRPGNAIALKVVPLTPAQTENESEMACSISSSCADVPVGATVRITGEISDGNEVLHWRSSGELTDRFQLFGCGHPPDCGTVETKL